MNTIPSSSRDFINQKSADIFTQSISAFIASQYVFVFGGEVPIEVVNEAVDLLAVTALTAATRNS